MMKILSLVLLLKELKIINEMKFQKRIPCNAIVESIKFYFALCVVIFITYVPIDFFLKFIEDSFFKNIIYYLEEHYKSENIETAYYVGAVKRSILIFLFSKRRRNRLLYPCFGKS